MIIDEEPETALSTAPPTHNSSASITHRVPVELRFVCAVASTTPAAFVCTCRSVCPAPPATLPTLAALAALEELEALELELLALPAPATLPDVPELSELPEPLKLEPAPVSSHGAGTCGASSGTHSAV